MASFDAAVFKSYFDVVRLLSFICASVSGQTVNPVTASTTRKYSYNSWDIQSGTENWGSKFPACNGQRQSPINIITASVQRNPRLDAMRFESYNAAPEKWIISNTGREVVFTAMTGTNDSLTPGISNGGLPEKYTFVQMHLHWGQRNSTRGSEHLVDDFSFPLELHLVHLKAGIFSSMNQSTAANKTASAVADGTALVVVGIFISASNVSRPSPWFDEILKAMRNVPILGDVKDIKLTFPLQALLPIDRSFFRYNGSLTSPPCTESTIWTVMQEPIRISFGQLDLFRSWIRAKATAFNYQLQNLRPVQPLNGRVVSYYESPERTKITSSSGNNKPSLKNAWFDRVAIAAVFAVLSRHLCSLY